MGRAHVDLGIQAQTLWVSGLGTIVRAKQISAMQPMGTEMSPRESEEVPAFPNASNEFTEAELKGQSIAGQTEKKRPGLGGFRGLVLEKCKS